MKIEQLIIQDKIKEEVKNNFFHQKWCENKIPHAEYTVKNPEEQYETQTAIEMMAVFGGGTVFFEPGNYNILKALDVFNNVNLVGKIKGEKIIKHYRKD